MRRHARRLLTRVAVGFVAGAVLGAPAPVLADDPEPGTAAWYERDAANQAYAMGRPRNWSTNRAAGEAFFTECAATQPDNLRTQLRAPDRPIVTFAQLFPCATTADPYRHRWEGERGIRTEVEWTNRYGARITGNLWSPALPHPDARNGPFPGVVITTGSIQGWEEAYWWSAQGLAEAGYVVLTYDVQGQGQSETFAHRPDGSLRCGPGDCPGVPSQQEPNFVEGTEDALTWFLSETNPLRGLVDETRIGLAGHSLGAAAVTRVGNRDGRVDAVVGWDNANLGGAEPRIPTMGQNADYFMGPQPQPNPPAADAKQATFRRFQDAGVDTMQVALRGSTHLEWTAVPMAASEAGERVAMYYTLAWLDRYLYPQRADDALRRLTAPVFDASADASSIGIGAYDAGSDRNVPVEIAGDRVADHLSIYYRSSYDVAGLRCVDMRAGCP